jgi:hypothetical protein
VAWVETESPSFCARHADGDADDVVGVLELLESTRAELAAVLPASPPGPVEVVVHSSRAQLYAAQPHLPALTWLTAPAARRYLTGSAGAGTLHLLAPRLLVARASNVPGSREMALLAPATLYAQLALGHVNPRLPPPLRLRSLGGLGRWAWLAAGAAQWLSGQTAYARPAIARRLREGPEPSFPPGPRDAVLLGGSVVDLLAREEGDAAAIELACTAGKGVPATTLVGAFHGRALVSTEGNWRAHLARQAGQA